MLPSTDATNLGKPLDQATKPAPQSGQDEDALLRGEGKWWWRRHDEYEEGGA